MSTAPDEEALKRRYREFLDLMPLTVAIAGLPMSQGMLHFTPDQMDLRAQALKAAYKLARLTIREAINS